MRRQQYAEEQRRLEEEEERVKKKSIWFMLEKHSDSTNAVSSQLELIISFEHF